MPQPAVSVAATLRLRCPNRQSPLPFEAPPRIAPLHRDSCHRRDAVGRHRGRETETDRETERQRQRDRGRDTEAATERQ